MTRLIHPTLIAALCLAPAHAREVTVEMRPFTIRQSFEAKVVPAEDAVLVELDPQRWTDFQITEIAPHGSHVAKNDTLIRFDTEDIDRKLADLRTSVETKTLKLAQAEDDLSHLVTTSAHRIAAAKRAAQIAREDNSYFLKTKRKAEEENSAQQLERKKQMLENQREELRQLKLMYKADDLTEDTEEIILIRQKNNVIAAEFAVKMATLSHEYTLNVRLPRQAAELADKQRDTAIALAKAEADIPREIKLKKLEVAELRNNLKREQEQLAELEADRKLFEIKAPADGLFLHGPVIDGKWSPSGVDKSLDVHGNPPVHRPLATLIPASCPLSLVAFLEENAARSLDIGVKGSASPVGREEIEIPVTVNALSSTKNTDGKFRIDLAAEWPETNPPAPNSTLKVRLIPYHKEKTVSLPTSALRYDPEGWTVEVKLADGKTERRPVQRGRVSGESTEILSGLEVGQVVIVSD